MQGSDRLDSAASPQAAARALQRVEALCAAAIRALSGERDLQFRGHRLHRGGRALPLFGPHLQPSPADDDVASFRGAADAIGLRLRLSDPALHRRLCPADGLQRWVFELLEQCRVESLAPSTMPGLVHNLRHRFEAWSLAFHRSGLTETARGLLLYTLAQVGRSRVTAQPVVEATEGLIESTRMSLAPRIGHALAGLRRERFDQAGYAAHALAIAAEVGRMLRELDDAPDPADPARNAADEGNDRDLRRGGFSLLLDFDAEVDAGVAGVDAGGGRARDDLPDVYRVFTTAHDREHRAGTLVRRAALDAHRERLDRLAAEQRFNLGRLARQLEALFARPATGGWDDDQEAGRIDGRRLARLVAVPAERRLFRIPHAVPRADAVVGLLVDCSGSMKPHIELVARLVDGLARALDQAGVASELLGFTTGGWHGGQARRDWLRAGRPAQPGRLNERWHLVFKDADTPWRRARRDIAALLALEHFREGVDGEAVDWACDRLAARAETRRVLIVISDGCPMDGATAQANDAQYLDRHLRQVVARRSRRGDTEILGLGVDADLSPWYAHCTTLDLSRGLGNAAFDEIVDLLAGRRR